MNKIREVFSNRKHEVFLLIILVTAAAMRFYHYNTVSLSNDELSALNRIRYDNVLDVIKHGSMMEDTHPAGVHVFIYFWVSIFGTSETAVRFPFIIAGILSVFLSYLIASKWFNKNTGLFTAANMAVIGYAILYSQFARPYSIGLFVTLASVYFWNRVLFENGKIISYAGFVIFSAMATYTHYFSQMFAVIVGITGLFFVTKKNIRYYLLSGLAIFILYLPHLKIFFYQYENGFVNVSWIPKPEPDWFFNYLAYCFNNSWNLGILVVVIVITSVILRFKKSSLSGMQIVALLWFLLPFFIGYFFSVYKSPMLQYSVLLFSFPYFLMLIYSFVAEQLKPLMVIFLVVLIVTGILTTAFETRFYTKQNYAEFKGIAGYVKKWNMQYGSDKITRVVNLNAPYYIHYYLDKIDDHSAFAKYKIAEAADLKELVSIVEKTETPYFLFSTSNAPYLPESKFIIMDKYPCIIEEKNYFPNSFITLLGKDPSCKKSGIFESLNDFEHEEKLWETDKSMIDTANYFSGRNSCRLDDKKVYSSCFRTNYASLPVKDTCWICVSANVLLTDGATSELVFSVEKPGRENEWYGTKIQDVVKVPGKWEKVYLAHILGIDMKPDDIIKAYVWNTGKGKVYVDDLKFTVYPFQR